MKDYAYVAHSPFTSWKHKAYELTYEKGGYKVFIDFDKNNDGIYNDPVKTISNPTAQ